MSRTITRALVGAAFVTVTVAFAQQAHVAADLRSQVESQHQSVGASVTSAERSFDDQWYAHAEAADALDREADSQWVSVDDALMDDGSPMLDVLTEGERQDWTGCITDYLIVSCPDGYTEEIGQTEPTVIPTIEGPDGVVHADCAVIAMSNAGSLAHCADGWEQWS